MAGYKETRVSFETDGALTEDLNPQPAHHVWLQRDQWFIWYKWSTHWGSEPSTNTPRLVTKRLVVHLLQLAHSLRIWTLIPTLSLKTAIKTQVPNVLSRGSCIYHVKNISMFPVNILPKLKNQYRWSKSVGWNNCHGNQYESHTKRKKKALSSWDLFTYTLHYLQCWDEWSTLLMLGLLKVKAAEKSQVNQHRH